MTRRAKIAVFGATISALIAVAYTALLIGHPARVVDIVTLFGGGFGAGAGVAVAIAKARPERSDKALYR